MAEIKEIKEKSQKDEDLLNSIAAGNRHYIMPNLEFEYTDTDIHEDAFKIIKYSCEEICTSREQLNKILNLWTTFLEPMLGVPSQHCNSRVSTKNDGPCGSPGPIGGTVNPNQLNPACNGDACKSPDRVHSRNNVLVNGERDTTHSRPSNVTENGHDSKSKVDVLASQVKLYITLDKPAHCIHLYIRY